MKQNRRQAVANARRSAANRVNRRRASATSMQGARMRSATGQLPSFQRPAGEFRSAGHTTSSGLSTKKKTALAVSKLLPFL